MEIIAKGLKLDYIVEWVKSYWDDIKEDVCGNYWTAYVVNGLDDFCRKQYNGEVRPKDLMVCDGFKSEVSADEAINKLKKELQDMGISGKLHKITREELIKQLKAKGRLVVGG